MHPTPQTAARIPAHPRLRFLLKFFIFVLPILLIISVPLWALDAAGELTPASALAARYISDPSFVVGLAYSNPMYYLSLQSVLAEHPQVLVLGSSRVVHIRSAFFKPGVGEFSISGLQEIIDLRQVLDAIPDSDSPRVIVVGMDQKFFDPSYASLEPDNITSRLTKPISFFDIADGWWKLYPDYLAGKFSLAAIAHHSSSIAGIGAITGELGYRTDGSMDIENLSRETWESPAAADYQFQSTLGLISQGGYGFEYSNGTSSAELAELDAFLADAKARNIYVVGFMQPLAAPVYTKLESMPGDYGYINSLTPDVGPIFQKYGFAFYNFTDLTSIPITDNEMEDGLHTTERGSLMMLTKIAETNPTFAEYADPRQMNAILASTTAEFHLL